jgi:hypothetical protein
VAGLPANSKKAGRESVLHNQSGQTVAAGGTLTRRDISLAAFRSTGLLVYSIHLFLLHGRAFGVGANVRRTGLARLSSSSRLETGNFSEV